MGDDKQGIWSNITNYNEPIVAINYNYYSWGASGCTKFKDRFLSKEFCLLESPNPLAMNTII